MIIKTAQYVISSPGIELCPKPDKPEFAFIGRSNVGKSSLINLICNQEKLAKTSSSPGKTQMINHFIINEEWYLVDLPGYGYAKVSQNQRKSWQKMIEDYFKKRENLGLVFVLIDSRLSPQKNDLDFINQLGDWQVPFALVFTKSDKNTQHDTAKNVRRFLETMKETWEECPPHFVTSTVKKTGKKEILSLIHEAVNDWKASH
jgi:GTP-binding protein